MSNRTEVGFQSTLVCVCVYCNVQTQDEACHMRHRSSTGRKLTELMK